MLQEALEVFQRCLSLQEYQFTQNKSFSIVTASSTGISEAVVDPSHRDGIKVAEEELWASVEVPVTEDSLIDTMIAQLGTLYVLSRVVVIKFSPPLVANDRLVCHIASINFLTAHLSRLRATAEKLYACRNITIPKFCGKLHQIFLTITSCASSNGVCRTMDSRNHKAISLINFPHHTSIKASSIAYQYLRPWSAH